MGIGQDNKKKKISTKPQGVFEALRDIGSNVVSTAKDEVVAASAQSAMNQLLGKTPSLANQSKDQGLITQEALEKKEKAIKQQERLFFARKRREERLVYSHREQEINQEIVTIQNELKRLAEVTDSVAGAAEELKVVATQPVVDPGVYHLHFLKRIKEMLILARKKIQESRTWLQVFSQRRKRRNYYWSMVGKKGTSYMLSPERYMSTQAG